jgi:hypothetical protein
MNPSVKAMTLVQDSARLVFVDGDGTRHTLDLVLFDGGPPSNRRGWIEFELGESRVSARLTPGCDLGEWRGDFAETMEGGCELN